MTVQCGLRQDLHQYERDIMKTYIAVDREGNVMRIQAPSAADMFRIAKEAGFEIFDWEYEEGEEFDV